MDGGHSKWMEGHSKKSKEGHSKTLIWFSWMEVISGMDGGVL